MKICHRTIDRPLLILGLELEDIGLLAGVSGAVMVFYDTFYGGMVFFGGWWLIMFLKRGKPQGYITHLLYKLGFKIEGLLPPPEKVSRYAIFNIREGEKCLE